MCQPAAAATTHHTGPGSALRAGVLMRLVFLVALVMVGVVPVTAHAAQSTTEAIHVMAFPASDAIILESNGRFAFVDSGEDRDAPDGSDPRYPWRAGIVPSSDYEDTLWAYLDQLGVNETNVEFYLGTHAHSDHIGTADTVISRYKPRRIYTPEYSDAWITDPGRLWDNQYVYDQMIEAAHHAHEEYGAALIQHLSPGAPLVPDSEGGSASPEFDFGDMHIEIVNYGEEYKTNPVPDANHMCWGVKVTAHGRTAFLAGDIENTAGAEDRIAGQIGDVDFLKLGHHGTYTSNSEHFLEVLQPEFAVQTGAYSYLFSDTVEILNRLGTRWYTAEEVRASGSSAVVVTLDEAGVSLSGIPEAVVFRRGSTSPHVVAYQGGRPAPQDGWRQVAGTYYWFSGSAEAVEDMWLDQGGTWYYLSSSGAMATGWGRVGGNWYYFRSSGGMATGWLVYGGSWYHLNALGAMSTGWVQDDGTWYYMRSSGAMATGWVHDGSAWYYLRPSGAMATGWVHDGSAWYYLRPSGAMATGWVKDGGAWYYLRSSGAMATGRVWIAGRLSEFSSSGVWLGYRS